jgi:hypothetical protein
MHLAESSAHATPSGAETRSVNVTDAALLFFAVVINVVIVILALRLMTLLTPFRVAAIAAVCTLLMLRAFGISRIQRDVRPSWWLLGAVTAGMLLASQLAPHYAAGQDQGYYTAMAEMLARGEPIAFVDRFREQLPADLRQIYDAMKVWGVEERPGGRQVLQFYSLHPALMALATQLLGGGRHTIFMLLCFAACIVATYLLTFEISRGSRKLAALAAWLVALNPAYVFFAKFPVTEITAAAMIALSCYFLLVAYRARSRHAMLLHGSVAILFMMGFCFTRMSFPEVAPFLLVLSAVLFFIPGVRLVQKLFVAAFVALGFGCYALSMFYYHAVMPELFWAIVNTVYLPALQRGRWLIAVGAGGGLIVLAALAWPRTRARTLAAVTVILRFGERTILTLPGLVVLLVALPSIIFLVRTGTLDAFVSTAPRPGLAMIRFHAVYVLMAFMSPFLFVLLLAGTKPVPEADRGRLLPALLLVTVWPIYMTFASSLPYLYYYGRYLVLEVLPAAIIVAVLAFDSGRLPRRAAAVLVALGLGYSACFSLVQLDHAEGEAGRPFHQIAAHLAAGDILAVDGAEFTAGLRSQVVIPLRYALGISTFILPPGSMESRLPVFERLRGVAHGRVYFMTYERALDTGNWLRSGLEKIESIPFDRVYMRMDDDPSRWRGWILPYRVTRGSGSSLALYRLPHQPLLPALFGTKVDMSTKGLGHLLTREGWSEPEAMARWTAAETARLIFDLPSDQPKASDLRLTLFASAFQQQSVEFVAGGTLLARRQMGPEAEEVTLDVPASAVRNNQLEILFRLPDARSPKAAGLSGDPRLLGLAMRWIRLDHAR